VADDGNTSRNEEEAAQLITGDLNRVSRSADASTIANPSYYVVLLLLFYL